MKAYTHPHTPTVPKKQSQGITVVLLGTSIGFYLKSSLETFSYSEVSPQIVFLSHSFPLHLATGIQRQTHCQTDLSIHPSFPNLYSLKLVCFLHVFPKEWLRAGGKQKCVTKASITHPF